MSPIDLAPYGATRAISSVLPSAAWSKEAIVFERYSLGRLERGQSVGCAAGFFRQPGRRRADGTCAILPSFCINQEDNSMEKTGIWGS
jgi:hypothetical protein